jgi:hypothetical protein
MLLNQELIEEDGKTVLRNTIDVSQAIEKARKMSETQARGKNIVP